MSDTFHQLDKAFLKEHVSDFIALCQRNMKDEYWDESHFLTELPQKWVYSFYVSHGDEVIGFIVASEKEQSIHIHKFVVDQPFQGSGLGSRMLQHLVYQSQKPITLKVRTDNEQGISFYKKHQFSITYSEKDMFSMLRSIAI